MFFLLIYEFFYSSYGSWKLNGSMSRIVGAPRSGRVAGPTAASIWTMKRGRRTAKRAAVRAKCGTASQWYAATVAPTRSRPPAVPHAKVKKSDFMQFYTVFDEINAHPEISAHKKSAIFQRGEYTKPMGLWWVIFQRGEYTKPMGFGMFFYCF